jgi:predicted GIY-YIG superfamily endonuclease
MDAVTRQQIVDALDSFPVKYIPDPPLKEGYRLYADSIVVEDLLVRGLYMLWLNKVCVYVGMSQNVTQRVLQHKKGWSRKKATNPIKEFDRVTVFPMQDEDEHRIRLMEQRYISKFKPLYNK